MPSTYLCRPKSDYINSGPLGPSEGGVHVNGNWQVLYGASCWNALTTEDDGNSLIEAGQPSRYYHALLDKPQVGTVYASTCYARMRSAFATPDVTHGTCGGRVHLGRVDVHDDGCLGEYVVRSDSPSANDVNLATFGAGVENDGVTNPQSPQVSWLRLDLSYDPPTGEGYAYLVASFLGPLVALGLHDMPGLVSYFNRRAAEAPWWHQWARHRLGLEDCAKIWEALRSARWPSYST